MWNPPKNFWYDAAMKEIKDSAAEGIQPTIAELITVAQLEQLYRIADALETSNRPKIRRRNELEKRIS